MPTPFIFYQEQLDHYNIQLDEVKKQLTISSVLRLLVFFSTLLGTYLVWGIALWTTLILAVGLALFLVLVSRHTDLIYKRDKLRALTQINKTEMEVLEHNFHGLPDGSQFKDSGHHFSQDIDLFGRGSFYQYCNRTALGEGSQKLSWMFLENALDHIQEKQSAIHELAGKPKWRQEFSAEAQLVKTDIPVSAITNWLESYTPFVPKVMKYIPLIFSGISLVICVLCLFSVLPPTVIGLWLLLGLGISGMFMGKVKKLAGQAGRVLNTVRPYGRLISRIEDTTFNTVLLRQQKAVLENKDQKASRLLRSFSRYLNGLDKNGNLFYLFLGNGLFLSSVRYAYQIEEWIGTYGNAVASWFEVIIFFDAYASLGNFAFNHPSYVYPTLMEAGESVLKLEDVGHPLLREQQRVSNSIHLDRGDFHIITGANMAGKSTFLRTLALQVVMANLGLPVCASKMEYTPIKLITSMRTTDSLTDDESYFFSELKRLKFIVDEIHRESHLVILDEILKGTNSTDKAMGSRKFLERLVHAKSTGIIATHDLALCEVAQELPEVRNFYFDAEIVEGELYFDYKLKHGICKNVNASFLLKKMKII